MSTEQFETVIVGGGQAGLSMGYQLAKRNRPFVILDSGARIGDSWRDRWDSMRLFTPAAHDGLPGLEFPAAGWSFPGKDAMAEYLEDYAAKFQLPVRTGARVQSLSREDGRFMIRAGGQTLATDNVVIATGPFQGPRIPEFASRLDPSILQMHSSEYRNPDQLRDGEVLLVGAGNSGADIALELARDHKTWLSGRHPGHVPIRIERRLGRTIFPLLWFAWGHVLTIRTPIGRKVQAKELSGGDQLIRVKPSDLDDAGVERVARTAGVEGGLPVLEDGRVMDVPNVIWCTGYRRDASWIELEGVDRNGATPPPRGIVDGEPGLYFLGRHFQYSFRSHTVGGVGGDAKHIAGLIEGRSR